MWYLAMLVAMLLLTLQWTISFVVLVGVGLAFQAILCPDKPNGRAAIHSLFWFGTVGSLCVLLIWNFWAPIRSMATLTLCGISALGWITQRRTFEPSSGLLAQFSWRSTVVAVAACFVLSNQCTAFFNLYDSELYHVQMIRWIQTYAVPPGLANLDCRFGFNNLVFLIHSVFVNLSGQPGLPSFNGLLAIVTIVDSLWAIDSWRSRTTTANFATRFRALSFLPVVLLGALPRSGSYSINSSSLDVTLVFFTLAAFRELALANTSDGKQLTFHMAVSGALFAATSAFRPLAGICLVCFCVSFASWKSQSISPRISIGRFARCVLLPTMLLALWAVRGVITSGYLVYPNKHLYFSVDWLVSRHQIDRLNETLLHFARHPQLTEPPLPTIWISQWFQREFTNHMLCFTLPIAIIVFSTIALVTCRASVGFAANAVLKLAVASGVLTLIAWWTLAPDPRYAFHVVLTLLVVFLAALLQLGSHSKWYPRLSYVAATALVLMAIQSRVEFGIRYWGLSRCVQVLFIPPPNANGVYELPTRETNEITNSFGLTISVPSTGDRVGDAPLPSAPFLPPQIRTRRPNDLSSGFQYVRQP